MTLSDSAVPIEERYFEDYVPGAVFEYGEIRVDEAEIIYFARCFDPQDMHVDPEAAARGRFGGLIASGWHTAAMMMRLLADNFLPRVASLGSPGIDELRWLKPVRPGDTLTARLTVTEATPSRSKPDRGIIRSVMEMRNQHGDVVMTTTGVNFFSRRPA